MTENKNGVAITTGILLIFVYLLNVIDYLQTTYAIKLLGLGVEANPIGRFLFENDCALLVKLFGVLILLLIIGFITIKIAPNFMCLSVGLLIFYIYVVLHNFSQLKQAGILNFSKFAEHMAELTAIVCFIVIIIATAMIGLLCAYSKSLNND